MKKIELLAPAGDLERLKIAAMYGADAIFIGGKRFSLRSRASNFDIASIKEGVDFAKTYNAHVHVTINMLPHDSDLDGLKTYIKQLEDAGVTAVICASLHIALQVLSLNTSMEVHLSTQQSTLNKAAVEFYEEMGIKRVVLGRELSLDQVVNITEAANVDIEAFIHGGMCSNFSGRCTMSNYMTFRDANRGGCAQSCRWSYEISANDEIISDENTLYSQSSKDLMSAEYIEGLIKGNIRSLKIEGRMKSLYYIATVVRGYRHLIDEIYEKGSLSEASLAQHISEITRAENRPVAGGFYGSAPSEHEHIYRVHAERVSHDFLGRVLEVKDNHILLEVRNRFEKGDTLEFFGPDKDVLKQTFTEAFDAKTEEKITVCNKPMQHVWIKTDLPLQAHYFMRKGD
ncbi:MAG: U32 family peptidase [Erysipelothrix sp.]|nr:U32 family peptidase [Erysipelothrix sp.]